ncbi:hypothetical protein SAMN05518683_10873 [Salibacterium halotolerans]|uniref:Uncharacterized protein n=1 Tax=Salibacterium halotolerans TaxID=1884432 RepID=A0A1I5S700_9BACI|nr:hypothetical protein SAMN05518683_10873 [Salibacterium halotolerans]
MIMDVVRINAFQFYGVDFGNMGLSNYISLW